MNSLADGGRQLDASFSSKHSLAVKPGAGRRLSTAWASIELARHTEVMEASSSDHVLRVAGHPAGRSSRRPVIRPGCHRAGLGPARRDGPPYADEPPLSVAGEDVGGRSHLSGQVLTGLGLGGLTHLLFRLADGAA